MEIVRAEQLEEDGIPGQNWEVELLRHHFPEGVPVLSRDEFDIEDVNRRCRTEFAEQVAKYEDQLCFRSPMMDTPIRAND